MVTLMMSYVFSKKEGTDVSEAYSDLVADILLELSYLKDLENS